MAITFDSKHTPWQYGHSSILGAATRVTPKTLEIHIQDPLNPSLCSACSAGHGHQKDPTWSVTIQSTHRPPRPEQLRRCQCRDEGLSQHQIQQQSHSLDLFLDRESLCNDTNTDIDTNGSHNHPINNKNSISDRSRVSPCPRSTLFLSWAGAEHVTHEPLPCLPSSSSLSSSSLSSSASSLCSSSSSAASSVTSSPSSHSYRSTHPAPSPRAPAQNYHAGKRATLPSLFSFPSLSFLSLSSDNPSTSLSQAVAPHQLARRARQSSVPVSTLAPRSISLRSPSLFTLPFSRSRCSSSQLSTTLTGETTRGTTLSCAYSQPFIPVSSINRSILSPTSLRGDYGQTSTNSLLRTLDSLSTPPSLGKMGRQRSQSTSSMGMLTKSPISLTASLSTSVALYDKHQSPNTLQDILLLAQSHYISHRYIPAMTLYRLAAERHHSLPACGSLYALYTLTLNVPGLVRSDTKAIDILIYALRIWTARRWSSSRLSRSGSRRSQTRDEHDELEEYFAHPRRITRTQQKPVSGSSIPIRRKTDRQSRSIGGIAQSVESEYRTPLHLASRSNTDLGGDVIKNLEEESGNEDHEDCEDCEDSDDCDEYDEDDEVDEEQEREEQARRIGLATEEIEDIVQKLCSMIQKGILGLEEPALVEAVSTLRKIEHGLSKEAEAWTRELAKSKSLFTSTLSGNATDEANSTRPDLLLTRGIDLSFLNFSPDDDSPMAKPQPARRSAQTSSLERLTTLASPEFSASPVNFAISSLPSDEKEQDQTMCRAIRIRVMFTLGWVHQKKNEYHYGAQAYGVCSEIVTTGKRPLNTLQHQASVQKQVCRALKIEEQEKSKSEPFHAQEPRTDVAPSSSSSSLSSSLRSSRKTSIKDTCASSSSSIYNSSETSTTSIHPDISSPSSLSSSDSGLMSIRGPVSSLSAAVWNSGLFRSNSNPSVLSPKKESLLQPSSTSGSRLSSNLRHSKSLHELKVGPSETAVAIEAKDSHHHHPRVQQGSKGHQHQAPVLTMSGHQKRVVKCGYCNQSRVLMPLCVCRKVRYCNGECRRADLDTHRLTGCHAANISIGASLAVSDGHSSASTDVAL